MKMRSRSDKRRILNRWPYGSAQQSASPPSSQPQNTKVLRQEIHSNATVPRSRVKVQSVTFPSTGLILNSGLRPVSMRTCGRLHLQVGTRRECVCAPIYIFSFRRSSWGTAYDKNNLTGLNARTACIRAAALSCILHRPACLRGNSRARVQQVYSLMRTEGVSLLLQHVMAGKIKRASHVFASAFYFYTSGAWPLLGRAPTRLVRSTNIYKSM